MAAFNAGDRWRAARANPALEEIGFAEAVAWARRWPAGDAA